MEDLAEEVSQAADLEEIGNYHRPLKSKIRVPFKLEIKNSLYFFNFDLDTNVIKKDIDGSVVIINSNDIFKKNGIKWF